MQPKTKKTLRAPAPKKTTRHASIIRTHDGHTWEAACACGFRSPLSPDRLTAELAGTGHEARSS